MCFPMPRSIFFISPNQYVSVRNVELHMLIVVLNDLRPNFFKKRENTKNEIFEKNFPFLRQRHRFRGGKAETGPRYGNATD